MSTKENKVYTIKAGNRTMNTKVKLPSSKSISNRVLIINALSYSPWNIGNLSDSDDTHVLVAALNSDRNVFDIGHAGTAMRFLTAFLAKIAGEWIITGSERMKQRPVRILVDALRKMGAHIEYPENEGYPPLRILGSHLKGGIIELDGSVSSQYISALLMIAPTLEGGLTLRLKNRVTSRSYIEMTLRLMDIFGVRSIFKNNEIRVDEQNYRPVAYSVESDWSAASYWYEILALSDSGEIELEGLKLSGLQGDEAVAEWFRAFGVDSCATETGITITKVNETKPGRLSLNFHETPDMAQTMAALCVAKGVPFHFTGLETLKIKETNRIAALQNELLRFGALLKEPAEGELSWDGSYNPSEREDSPLIETYNDHRMALAFAPLALTSHEVRISEPGVVTKSYPAFWKDLEKAKFQITE
jgi:3-phosphoshikimate 1-carboxyvinyltransferase